MCESPSTRPPDRHLFVRLHLEHEPVGRKHAVARETAGQAELGSPAHDLRVEGDPEPRLIRAAHPRLAQIGDNAGRLQVERPDQELDLGHDSSAAGLLVALLVVPAGLRLAIKRS